MCSISQSCPTLCDPMDYSLLGSSAHGIFQARMLSGLPFPSLGDLPNPEIKPTSLMSVPLAGGFFTTSATWETKDIIYLLIVSLLQSQKRKDFGKQIT